MSRAIILFFILYSLPLIGQVDLDEGLVVFYPFDNGALADFSGNDYDGSPVGSLPLLSDSSLILLNSFGETYVEIPFESFDGTVDFTVSVQFNYQTLHYEGTTQNGANGIISGASTLSPYANDFLITYRIWDQSFVIVLNSVNYYFTDITILENTWYCLSVVRTDGVLRVYLDGLKLEDQYLTPNSEITLSEGGLLIGQEQDCVAGCFDPAQSLDGEIDNLRFYNRALNEEELATYCVCPDLKLGEDCVVATAQKNLDLEQDITIFPNPASQLLNVQSTNLEIRNLTLLNSLGMTMRIDYSMQDSNFVKLSITDIPTGHYFLKVLTDQGIVIKPLIIF